MMSSPSHRDDDRQGDATRAQRRRLVEDELERVKRETELTRLRAREADLTKMLQQIDQGEDVSLDDMKRLGLDEDAETNADTIKPSSFSSWDDVRRARRRQSADAAEQKHAKRDDRVDGDKLHDPRGHKHDGVWTRRDGGQPGHVPAPAMRLDPSDAGPALRERATPDDSTSLSDKTGALDELTSTQSGDDLIVSPQHAADAIENESSSSVGLAEEKAFDPTDLEVLVQPDDQVQATRTRPIWFLASTLMHNGLILVLMTVTLSTQLPKDQVALSASVSQGEEAAMETFSIETSEPVTEPAESAPAETEYDLSPIGEMMAVDVTSDVIGQSIATPTSLSSLSSATETSLKSLTASGQSSSKMEFCGVEGGGNHFVYLVDSSGSMGDAFVSARQALLQSIEMLSEKQRFYVVFFDAQPDFMRLSDPKTDESKSVYATPENKQRLRHWAMRIQMDRGRAPYDPLRFALGLKPDVIFLLSDGEFPQGIEDLLLEENRVSNLFGETNPVSIVHTISYHSQEGESRMRRIAAKNFGQYRYIPKP
ncbi:MAG: vWA domain-containing protein [Planctomycetota bacterium]